jgi:uncharacterized membrane protein YoaK (UPF0700 family)
MVNALTLLACQRFVTHVTGTLTQIGADYARPLLLLDYLMVTLSFILGALLSYRLIDGRRVRGKEPWPTVPLFLVSGALALVAALGLAGVFGPFGQTVETSGDFLLLALLAFSMGLQNASVATTTGMIVRTTHMTGPLTDFAVALGAWMSPAPPAMREAARESARLRGMKILAFVVGCACAAVVGPRLQYAAYAVPAALVAAAGWWLRAHLQFLQPVDEPSRDDLAAPPADMVPTREQATGDAPRPSATLPRALA